VLLAANTRDPQREPLETKSSARVSNSVFHTLILSNEKYGPNNLVQSTDFRLYAGTKEVQGSISRMTSVALNKTTETSWPDTDYRTYFIFNHCTCYLNCKERAGVNWGGLLSLAILTNACCKVWRTLKRLSTELRTAPFKVVRMRASLRTRTFGRTSNWTTLTLTVLLCMTVPCCTTVHRTVYLAQHWLKLLTCLRLERALGLPLGMRGALHQLTWPCERRGGDRSTCVRVCVRVICVRATDKLRLANTYSLLWNKMFV